MLEMSSKLFASRIWVLVCCLVFGVWNMCCMHTITIDDPEQRNIAKAKWEKKKATSQNSNHESIDRLDGCYICTIIQYMYWLLSVFSKRQIKWFLFMRSHATQWNNHEQNNNKITQCLKTLEMGSIEHSYYTLEWDDYCVVGQILRCVIVHIMEYGAAAGW